MENELFRNVCFTDWGIPEERSGVLCRLIEKYGDLCNYIIFQQERGKEGGLHYQGYLELSRKCRFKRVKDIFESENIHIEPRYGTQKQAIEYCKKNETAVPGTLIELGHRKQQGSRSDIDRIQEFLDKDKGSGYSVALEREVATTWFGQWATLGRRFKDYMNLFIEPRSTKTTVILYWGNTDLGKSLQAKTELKDKYEHIHIQLGSYKWWDAYRCEQGVLLDDYEGQYELDFLLALMYDNPLDLPIKGGFVPLAIETLYITSNKPIASWYPDASKTQIEAIGRRIDYIEHFVPKVLQEGNTEPLDSDDDLIEDLIGAYGSSWD